MHFVGHHITVGGEDSFGLRAGDLLLAIDGNATLTSTNTLAVQSRDVFVFRPDTLGDYSSGTFTLLLDDPLAGNISGVSLVEQTTTAFHAVRLRTSAAKRFKRTENATAIIWRTLLVAQKTFRKLNESKLLPAVLAGRLFKDGKPSETAAA